MTGFTQTFGGQIINPAQLGFASYTVSSGTLVTTWPQATTPSGNALASKINVTASVPGLAVQMPDATLVTVGQDVLIANVGSNTFSVLDFNGNNIGSVASGQMWYFYITDNSTQGGVWKTVQFATGTSAAVAASLAGAGLQAASTILNQNLLITTLNGNYTPQTGDRATVLRNAGGVITLTPASAAALGLGWFVYVINNGAGNLTWSPAGGQTVDGGATKVLAPSESAIFFSDGANFWTLGYGRSLVTTVTATAIAITTGTVNLTSPQAAAQVQDYTGALTGNVILNYGVGAGYWFVNNNTNGAFTVTARVGVADAGIVVPQGSFTILRSNGSNMAIAFTATTGTVTSVGVTAGQLVGGPITTSGTLGLATTAVAAGNYGSASAVGTFTVDGFGRLTTAANSTIAIAMSQINAFASSAILARVTDPTGSGSLVFGTSPALTNPTATTQAAGDNSTLVATDAFVTAAVNTATPVGAIHAWPAAAAPNANWKLCDGSAISRTTFAALFALLGTTFGAGDGSTTFNLPDLRGRVIAMDDNALGRLGSGNTGGFTGAASLGVVGGEKSHQITVAEMPSHGHTYTGAASASTQPTQGGGASPFSGTTGLTGGDTPHNNVQPTLVLNYIIRVS